LHTGDVGSLDADSFLTLKDRSKDVIISGGSNIYPREGEECSCANCWPERRRRVANANSCAARYASGRSSDD